MNKTAFILFLAVVFVSALILTPIFSGLFLQQNYGYYQEKIGETRTTVSYKIVYESHEDSIHALFTIPKKWEQVPVFVIAPAASITKETEQNHLGNELNRLGYATFIIDPRGQGDTGGIVPTMSSDFMNFMNGGYPVQYKMVDDLFRAHEIVSERPEIDPENILIAGESMSGRHAIIAASLQQNFSGVLVISSSSYGFDTTGHEETLIEYMSSIEPLNYIGNITSRIAVVHGTQDDVIPLEAGRELFDAASEPKRFFEVSGGHSFESMDHSIIDEIIEWLDS